MKNTVTKVIAVALLLGTCVVWIHCDEEGPTEKNDNVKNTDFVAEESVSFKIAVTDQLRFRLEGINGNVSIVGVSPADSVMITGEKRVGSDSMADAQEHLQELEVLVQDSAEEIFVETDQPQETHGRSYVVDYTVTLPRDLEVLVTNINGTAEIESIHNSVTVNSVNGLVTLDEILGSALIGLTNGQITSRVTLPLDGTIEMITANGVIELHIPQNTSAEFSAIVGNGLITLSNLDLKDQVSSANSLSGTLGEGQGTIALSTGNGNIFVTGF